VISALARIEPSREIAMHILIGRPLALLGTSTLLLLAAGCAWQSTYDEAVAEREGVKAELQSTKLEQDRLAEQVRVIEPLAQHARQQAEQAHASLRDAIDAAEGEHQIVEERHAKLVQLIDQLTVQQNSLRRSIRQMKAQGPGLQATVDKYRTQLDEADRLSAAAAFAPPPPVHDPIASAAAPPLPASHPGPTVTPTSMSSSPSIPSADAPPASATRPATKRGVEPAEEGFLASMKDWLVSLWRSIFS